jgi:bla regulator protein blaR1
MKSVFLLALGISVIALPLLSQAPAGTKPSFEVATVKTSDPGQRGSSIMNQPGGRLVVSGMPLRALVTFAYRVRDFQISGGPGWMVSDRWDIEARAEEGSIPKQTGMPDPNTPDPMALRLQSLLEERFQLKIHRDRKELPVYELSIAKSGSKMKLSDDQTPFQPPERGAPPPQPLQRGGQMGRYSMRIGRGNLEAVAVDFANFVQALSQTVGRTVDDKTGLKGLYDIKLQWTPEVGAGGGPGGPGGPAPLAGPEAAPPQDPSGPSIFTAVQEQLGLKLDSAKGQVDVLVIDSVQKPTEN